MWLLLELEPFTGGLEDLHVFRGFNGRLMAKSPRLTAPGPLKIPNDQLLRFLTIWFSIALSVTPAALRKQFVA